MAEAKFLEATAENIKAQAVELYRSQQYGKECSERIEKSINWAAKCLAKKVTKSKLPEKRYKIEKHLKNKKCTANWEKELAAAKNERKRVKKKKRLPLIMYIIPQNSERDAEKENAPKYDSLLNYENLVHTSLRDITKHYHELEGKLFTCAPMDATRAYYQDEKDWWCDTDGHRVSFTARIAQVAQHVPLLSLQVRRFCFSFHVT